MLFVINARGKAQHFGIQLPVCCDLEETKMLQGGWLCVCLSLRLLSRCPTGDAPSGWRS